MATTKAQTKTPNTSKATIEVTPELLAALTHAAIGMGCDRTGACNSDEASDRNAGRILMDLAKTLGARISTAGRARLAVSE